uniref:Uncharacterized protein n=1 Tax=Caenorhabditis japonica TaxID=281687 RepID=A0A8R1EPS0_CAEJA
MHAPNLANDKIEMFINQIVVLERNSEDSTDVEKFLSITKASEISKGVGADNPQRARIRNNFERQNRKHAQETENLQKKLLDYEERLRQVDSGEYEPSPTRPRVFPSGIRKAKGVTESVMNAQMELAQRVKSALSADNVNLQNGTGDKQSARIMLFLKQTPTGETQTLGGARCQ